MKRFQNTVTLVTGGNRGIGRAIALRLASEGGKIILFGRKEEDNKAVENEILHTFGTEVQSCAVDVSSESSVKKGVEEALSRFGRVDVLINNAGICRLSTPFEKLRLEDWEETLSVNLYGMIYVTRLLIPELRKREGKLLILPLWQEKWEALPLLPTMWQARRPCRALPDPWPGNWGLITSM